MPDKEVEKPTLRQIISHNIRYKDESINNTIYTLDKFTTDIEYETLNLYLLGCTFNEGLRNRSLWQKSIRKNFQRTFGEKANQKYL